MSNNHTSDSTAIIYSDKYEAPADPEATAAFEAANNDANQAISPLINTLHARGYKTEIVTAEIVKPDGTKEMRQSIKLVHVPSHEKKLAIFFANPDAECDFPGCEELQRQFKDAVNAIGGAQCTPCERGKIIRRMSPIVLKAMGLRRDPDKQMIESTVLNVLRPTEKNVGKVIGLDKIPDQGVQSSENNVTIPQEKPAAQNSGPVEVSGSGSESNGGASNSPSLLRRAAKGIAKIFGIGT